VSVPPVEGAMPTPVMQPGVSAPTRDEAMTLERLIRDRRSVRRYAPRPVPREDLLAILDAARWAPSPHNTLPWRFALLTRPETKQHLADAMAERWVTDLSRDGLEATAIDAQVSRSRQRLIGAPAIVLASVFFGDLDQYPDPTRQSAEYTMAAQSLGAAVQTVMLAAHGRGLASCWMCAPLFCPDVVTAALGLPAGLIPQALVTMGYAALQPPVRERPPLEALLVLDS
jgi:coenzyme F420-0:L-glutamate ligase / coenzyme F420-1:gamma-L-glutamate ligase